jgi:hypothetical protein
LACFLLLIWLGAAEPVAAPVCAFDELFGLLAKSASMLSIASFLLVVNAEFHWLGCQLFLQKSEGESPLSPSRLPTKH